MWIEKIIDHHREYLEEYFKTTESFTESLNSSPFFTARWLYCMHKLGKTDTDCSLALVNEYEPILMNLKDQDRAKRLADQLIKACDLWTDKGITSEIIRFMKKVEQIICID